MSRLLPAEWAAQSGIMLTWPHGHGDWAWILDQVEPVFVEIAAAITRFEKLLICAYDLPHQQHIHHSLESAQVNLAEVRFAIQPSNDTWARDHGPITTLENGQPILLDFIFNGWGNKFDAALDNQINHALHTQQCFGQNPLEQIDFILEGGSIDSDGMGSLLTTEDCLLSTERNPGYSKQQIEAALCRWLGVQRILWLSQGELAGDDTDSHIDMLARFCDPQTIAYTTCRDPQDQHFQPLQAMEAELKTLTTPTAEPYRLIPLPIPKPIYEEDGTRLPASYANFLIINGAVLVPQYDDEYDQLACDSLAKAFPQRQIIGINCRQIIRQYGSLHCLTMQLPDGVLR